MKTTIIICFSLIAVAVAHPAHLGDDDRHRPEIEKLMTEAKQVLENANEFIRAYNARVGEYLLGNMRYEVNFVKQLLQELDTYHNQKDDHISADQLNQITEELKYRERRINEEEQIIRETEKNNPNGWTSVEVLIKRCNELKTRAQDFLNKHANDQHREIDALKNEIQQVDHLIEKLGKRASEKKPRTYREEEELIKHEKSIAKLIEDIEHA